jgi:flagellar biosynthetic protein FlhB
MADQGQRTEKPTKRKLDKARREGQFPASREFLAALQFLTFVTLVGVGGSGFLERTCEMARYLLAAAFRLQLTPHGVTGIYRSSVGHVFMPLFWMGVCLTSVALAGQLASTRLGLSFQKLAPDPKRLNPLQKIRNLPSQNMASFLQAIIFLPLLAMAVYGVAAANLAAQGS